MEVALTTKDTNEHEAESEFASRSPFAWLKPFRFERRPLPVAVAQLVLVSSVRGAVPLARLVHENVSNGRGAQRR
ncbi:MAG: hypothetical protein DME80_07070 [Verrucomicrobia bacterium]|nr:MAG: hypothetical protein DME80_07070 [Verrucomicrobiota bacterium]